MGEYLPGVLYHVEDTVALTRCFPKPNQSSSNQSIPSLEICNHRPLFQSIHPEQNHRYSRVQRENLEDEIVG